MHPSVTPDIGTTPIPDTSEDSFETFNTIECTAIAASELKGGSSSRVLKKIGLCLLLFIVQLLLLEVSARTFVMLAKPPESHVEAFDRKLQLARSLSPQKNTILLLGSSHTATGLYPEQLQSELRKSGLNTHVYNLGVCANTPELSLFLLKQAMKKGVKPALVVADVAPPWMFNRSYYEHESSTAYKFKRSYLGQCVAEKPTTLEGTLYCGASQVSYLVRHATSISSFLHALPEKLSRFKAAKSYAIVGEAQLETSPQGWSPMYPMPSKEEMEAYSATAKESALAPAYQHFQWEEAPMKALIAFCQQQKIPLVLVWMPEHPLQRTYFKHFQLNEAAFDKRLKALFNTPGVTYHNAHAQTWPVDLFENPDHFNVVGAVEYTRLFADVLSKQPYRSLLSEKPAP
jgi:hypothetical protein